MNTQTTSTHPTIPPFSASFTDSNLKVARGIYFKTLIGGSVGLIVAMFAIFSIYWGALWKTPDHPLDGWIVDFDQSTVGNVVVQALEASSASGKVTWSQVPSSNFPGGPSEVGNDVVEQKTWIAVVVNANATSNLQSAVASTDSSYNGSAAITVYGNQARSENGYNSVLSPTVQAVLISTAAKFAQTYATELASSSSNITNLLVNAPQIVTQPISFTINDLKPFDIPVATAMTYVGLIYTLILSFFIVNISLSARLMSGLETHLTTASIIRVRLCSSFITYFFLSLFYSLLSRAFQVDFSRKFGAAGFVIFWMLNWAGMLAVGLALEAMLTLLTMKGVPFFMILLIISNVSVCFMPIEVLPRIYRYGYAFPFYNISCAVRTILFGTKNNLGLNFGVLIAWTAISCVTLPLFQWFMRRRHISELNGAMEPDEKVAD
ncbi:hypothetical protein EV361DRAFT_794479 [Lentinula raphanica]|uniref:DUF3533 domain-containing protein n=1 Tax=Lentinula raphanica TaxID=153919 RepID=A0AA38NYP0_9AGAR|nr:hypothetical protein EV360DRAFT_53388 [Lentinula raphanica]KAJ3825954.1 hypothetical protein F5880DRAFT_1477274 [Lentinula raphanica]KAJ3833078.1 hypothetical protein F5878DRAFT_547187 [Lentinula raphanica]KAJ3974355.1 hypothetical protein EV361DRAFT_794479 [Lentinula raphanica]